MKLPESRPRKPPQEAAGALLLDGATIRGWRKLFEQIGIEGLTSFGIGEVIVVNDHGGARELYERRARRRFESMGRGGAAAFDTPGRRLDPEGIRPRL